MQLAKVWHINLTHFDWKDKFDMFFILLISSFLPQRRRHWLISEKFDRCKETSKIRSSNNFETLTSAAEAVISAIGKSVV